MPAVTAAPNSKKVIHKISNPQITNGTFVIIRIFVGQTPSFKKNQPLFYYLQFEQ
jgi:hypothetical protein